MGVIYDRKGEIEMEQFLTWDILKDYVTFVGIVFSIVAFTKSAWLIKKMPTRLWSFIVAFFLLLLVNLHESTFEWFDIVIYGINAILISSSANGIADANKGGAKNVGNSEEINENK